MKTSNNTNSVAKGGFAIILMYIIILVGVMFGLNIVSTYADVIVRPGPSTCTTVCQPHIGTCSTICN